jgi:phosphatidate phosphatase APP1
MTLTARRVMGIALFWVIVSVFISLLYFNDVSNRFFTTSKPVRRLVSRGKIASHQKAGNGLTNQSLTTNSPNQLNSNSSNSDRSNISAKTLLDRFFKKVENVKVLSNLISPTSSSNLKKRKKKRKKVMVVTKKPPYGRGTTHNVPE